MPDRAICPVCLAEYGAARLRGSRATCPDCDGEAMEIDLVSKQSLLERTSLESLLDSRERWAKARKDFLPEYHASKLARLDALVEAKRKLPAKKAKPAGPARRAAPAKRVKPAE